VCGCVCVCVLAQRDVGVCECVCLCVDCLLFFAYVHNDYSLNLVSLKDCKPFQKYLN